MQFLNVTEPAVSIVCCYSCQIRGYCDICFGNDKGSNHTKIMGKDEGKCESKDAVLEPNARIAEIEEAQSSPRPLAITLE